MNKRKKKIRLAYFLWFFFGWLGLHRFYLKIPLMGTAFIILQGMVIFCLMMSLRTGTIHLVSTPLSKKWSMAAAVLAICIFCLWIWDAFTISRQVDSTDKKILTLFQSFGVFAIGIICLIVFVFFLGQAHATQ